MQIFTNYYIVFSFVLLSLMLWKFRFRYDTKALIVTIYSSVVIALIHIVYLFIVYGVVLLLYYLSKLSVENKKRISLKFFSLTGIFIAVCVLAVGKYGPDMIESLFGRTSIRGFNIIVPIGISYFFIKILQYILDVQRGFITSPKFLHIAAYILFLPTFASGPIESCRSFQAAHIDDFSKDDYIEGIKRIIKGYIKKFVITDVIISYYIMTALEENFAYSIPWFQPLQPYVFVAMIFIKSYFDLSSYTDLAIGFSKLLGYRIAENFNRPLWKRNVSQFWRSWHMTLSGWCTTNIYFPVYGLTRKVWIGLYASMIFMGMWHHINLSWLAWGVHHATGLVLFSWFDRYKRKHNVLQNLFKNKVVVFFSHLLTFYYISLGYSFISGGSFTEAVQVYRDAILAIPKFIYHLFG